MLRFLVMAVFLLSLCGSGVGWLKLRQHRDALRVQLAAATSNDRDRGAKMAQTAPIQAEYDSHWQSRIAQLTRQLDEETANLDALVTQATSLDASIPIEADEIVTSFGTVESLGSEAGSVLRSFGNAVPALKHEWPEQEAEENGFDFNRMMQLFAWIPEVSGFESTPAEIANFQSEALGHLFQLEKTQTDRIRSIVAETFVKMNQEQLTSEHRPAQDADRKAWDARRSAALIALMRQLHPILPDSKPDTMRHILPAVLNLGIGVETNFQRDGDSATSTTNLPSWPKVPW